MAAQMATEATYGTRKSAFSCSSGEEFKELTQMMSAAVLKAMSNTCRPAGPS